LGGVNLPLRHPDVLQPPPDVHNARDNGLAGDGVTNDQPALAALVERLGKLYATDGLPRVIYCPPGAYRIADESTVWRSGVSLVGAGAGPTRFLLANPGSRKPVALASFTEQLHGASKQNFLADCTFQAFEIDGAGVALDKYDPQAKGLGLQYMMRATFHDLYIHDTAATGLGCDHLQDSVISDVLAIHCGRLNDGSQPGGAGIGIGIGGWGGIERTSISDCIAHGNATNGVFVELQQGKWPPPRGVKILGTHCTGNRHGISDWGADALLVADCVMLENLEAGYDVSQRGTSGVAGRGGSVSGCVIDGNVEDGVRIDGTLGPYTIRSSRISNNGGCGYRHFVLKPEREAPREIVLEGNDVFLNGADGVRFEREVIDACISANRIRNNGRQSGAAAGIALHAPMPGLWLHGNRIWDSQEKATQAHEVRKLGDNPA
jgi:hypothetical protein